MFAAATNETWAHRRRDRDREGTVRAARHRFRRVLASAAANRVDGTAAFRTRCHKSDSITLELTKEGNRGPNTGGLRLSLSRRGAPAPEFDH